MPSKAERSTGHLLIVESQERFDRLFTEQVAAVGRFVVRRVDSGAVEDVVSETFLIAWRRLEQIPIGTERYWLLATARWVISNHLRAVARQRRLSDRLAQQPVEQVTDHADTVYDASDDGAVVRAVLARLSVRDQEVLKLAEWDQLPASECAQLLGCTTATYSVRLHRARRRFRQTLEAAGAAEEDEVSHADESESTRRRTNQLKIEGIYP